MVRTRPRLWLLVGERLHNLNLCDRRRISFGTRRPDFDFGLRNPALGEVNSGHDPLPASWRMSRIRNEKRVLAGYPCLVSSRNLSGGASYESTARRTIMAIVRPVCGRFPASDASASAFGNQPSARSPTSLRRRKKSDNQIRVAHATPAEVYRLHCIHRPLRQCGVCGRRNLRLGNRAV